MFTQLEITSDLDQSPWSDYDIEQTAEAAIERIGLIRNGTTQGRAVIAIAVRLPDDRVVIAETTWRLFSTAARSLAQTEIARNEPQEP